MLVLSIYENLASNICLFCLIDRAHGIKTYEKQDRIERNLMNEMARRICRHLMNEMSRFVILTSTMTCKHGTIRAQEVMVENCLVEKAWYTNGRCRGKAEKEGTC